MGYRVMAVIIDNDGDEATLRALGDTEQIGGDDLTYEEARELVDAIASGEREGRF